MIRLLMLVEGQSEEIFVKKTLTPYLASHGVAVESPTLLWTKRIPGGGGFRGGVSTWNQIRKNLMPLFHDTNAWVTTLFDFYGLPKDFPGYDEAHIPGNPREKATTLQTRFKAEMNHPQFIPFFALHEFEAWLFCSPDIVSEHFGNPSLVNKVRDVVERAGEPEFINQGVKTHPKARLLEFNTGYKETSDGPILIEKIGIPTIKTCCPHFAGWLQRLEALGNSTEYH